MAGWLRGVIDGRPAQGRWKKAARAPPTPLVRQPIDRLVVRSDRRAAHQISAPSQMPARPFRMPRCVGPLQRPCRCCCPPRLGKTRPSRPWMLRCSKKPPAWRPDWLALTSPSILCVGGGLGVNEVESQITGLEWHVRGGTCMIEGCLRTKMAWRLTQKGEDVDCAISWHRCTTPLARGGWAVWIWQARRRCVSPNLHAPAFGRSGRRGNAKARQGWVGCAPCPHDAWSASERGVKGWSRSRRVRVRRDSWGRV